MGWVLKAIQATLILWAASVHAEIRRNTPLKRLVDSCFVNSSNCCFSPGEGDWVQRKPRCEFDPLTQSYPCSIKLGVSDWDNTFVNVYVAKIFIEEFLGYPVEIRADYSDFKTYGSDNSGTTKNADMWDELENGTLDAMLEVWKSGKEEQINKYIIEDGSIDNAGSIGLVGSIGWYIATHVLANDAFAPLNVYECTESSFFEYWRSLQSPMLGELFEDTEIERPCCIEDVSSNPAQVFPCVAAESLGGTPVSKGGFANPSDCVLGTNYPTYAGIFLAASPDWTHYDAEIIRNRGFNLTIEYAGNQQVLIDKATEAARDKLPLLFAYWEPNALFQQINLTRVILPRHTASCWSKRVSGGVDCDYPAELLFKMSRATLKNEFPDAVAFIKAMNFRSNEDQEKILAEVYETGVDFNTASCSWAKRPSNRETWSTWLDTVSNQFDKQQWRPHRLDFNDVVCDCMNGELKVFRIPKESTNLLVNITVDTNPCTSPGVSTYSTRWTNITYPSKLVVSTVCSYVDRDAWESVTLLVVCNICVLMNIGFFILLTIYRKNKFIRASNYVTLSTFLLGCTLLVNYPLNSIGEPDSFLCGSNVMFAVYGYNWFIGSLTIKLYVLHDIFSATSRKASRWNPILLRYQPIFNFLASSAMMSVWILVVGFEPALITPAKAKDQGIDAKLLQCSSNPLLFQLFLLISAILMTICFYLSYQTRHIVGAFSEARFNVLTAYNFVVFGIFAAFIVQNTGALTPGMEALYVGITIAWVTTVSSVLIVGSRLYPAMKGYTFDTREALIKSQKPRAEVMSRLKQSPSGRNVVKMSNDHGSSSANSNNDRSASKKTKRAQSLSAEQSNESRKSMSSMI